MLQHKQAKKEKEKENHLLAHTVSHIKYIPKATGTDKDYMHIYFYFIDYFKNIKVKGNLHHEIFNQRWLSYNKCMKEFPFFSIILYVLSNIHMYTCK